MTAHTLPIDFDQGPDFSRGAWQMFTANHGEDNARKDFEARYGRPPQHVALDKRYRVVTLKAGPVPEHCLDTK